MNLNPDYVLTVQKVGICKACKQVLMPPVTDYCLEMLSAVNKTT